MFKRLSTVVTVGLLLLLTTVNAYANTTADIYRIYGIKNIPDIAEEEVKLLEVYSDLFQSQARYNSVKMMDTAKQIYETEYIQTVMMLDLDIVELERQVDNALTEVKESGDKSVSEIVSVDLKYRGVKSALEQKVSERVVLTQQLQNVSFNLDDEKKILSTELKYNKNKVEDQEAVVDYIKSFKEIGTLEDLKYPFKTKEFRISSNFGWRLDPITRDTMSYHSGIDFAMKMNSEITTVFDGVVEASFFSSTSGHTVIVDHGNNVRTLYCHLNKSLVKEGQKLKQYDTIALSGMSGSRSTGPHLHFGLYIGGVTYDPSLLYK